MTSTDYQSLFPRMYEKRSCLVTGHTGFKGAWLCQWLHHLGANVTGFGQDPPPSTIPNLFNFSELEKEIGSQ